MDSSAYKRIEEKRLPKKPASENAESKHWHSFKQVLDKTYETSIKAINARNNNSNRIAITNGKSIEIFNTNKNAITQTLQRFKSSITSIQYRIDSQLMAVGLEDGVLQIMNMKSKTALRTFKNFKKPIHCLSFSKLEHLFAGSDEGIVKLFDVPGESVIRSIANAHSDFIRSIQSMGDQQILTSGYDRTIKLFDFRSQDNTPMQEFKLQHPVESLLVLPNNLQFVSAQDEYTTLWDIRKGIVQELHTNQKTVTCLTSIAYQDSYRIVSGALDHHVKYIRPDIFTVTHQDKCSYPVLAIDATVDGPSLAIGGSDGRLEIKQLQQVKEEQEDDEDFLPEFLKSNPHLQRTIKNYKFYNRGIYSKQTDYDVKVSFPQKQSFAGYDKLLVQFKYKEAILKAFRDKKSAMIISLYEELADRGALQIALSNLDADELNEMVAFIQKKISNPKFAIVMIQLANILLDIYSTEIISEQFIQAVQDELEMQKEMINMKGMISTMLKQ